MSLCCIQHSGVQILTGIFYWIDAQASKLASLQAVKFLAAGQARVVGDEEATK